MSSQDEMEVSSFETVEDEVKFWKDRYYQLDVNNQDLEKRHKSLQAKYRRLKSCHTCVKDDQDAKHFKADESTMDPLVKLEEPIFHKIMKYLSGKQLLKAMTVSAGWKQFIEKRSSLMNRAMDQVVAKVDINNWPISIATYVSFDNSEELRPYRHMKSSVWVRLNTKAFSVARYAATLETLIIPNKNYCRCYDGDENRKIEQSSVKNCEFLKLRRLAIYQNNAIFCFKNCSFPAVTDLRFSYSDPPKKKSLRDILRSFPQLKSLEAVIKDENDSFDTLTIEADEQQPKIEKAVLLGFNSEFMKDQQNSLKDLKMTGVNLKQLSWLLRDLKLLKSLTLEVIFYSSLNQAIFPQNSSIEHLTIYGFNSISTRLNTDVPEFFRSLLEALPSLKRLEIGFWRIRISESLIKLIASHTSNLKMLIHTHENEVPEDGMAAYREVRLNPHLYLNSSFELVDKGTDPRYEEERERELHLEELERRERMYERPTKDYSNADEYSD